MNIIGKVFSLLEFPSLAYEYYKDNRKKIKFTHNIVDYNADIKKENELTKRYLEFKVENQSNKNIYLEEFSIKLKSQFEKNYKKKLKTTVTISIENKYKGKYQKTLPVKLESGDSISNFLDYNIFIAYLDTLIFEDKLDKSKKVVFIVTDKSGKQKFCRSKYSADKMIKDWRNINYL